MYDLTNDPPLSLPYFFFFLYFSLQQTPQRPPTHTQKIILSQINLSLQIQSSYHSVCQYLYSDSNFIEDSPLQISKTTHFLFKINFKMLIFIAYFCCIYILFWCLLVL